MMMVVGALSGDIDSKTPALTLYIQVALTSAGDLFLANFNSSAPVSV